jgi:tetratricopeptide (TPR) repeat protein
LAEGQIASIEQIYGEGRKLLAGGMIETACEAFCRVLSACPDTLDDVARAFGPADVRREAIETLLPMGDADRVGSANLALAARLASNEGWLDKARQWAERAVEKSPSCASWWFELGEVCRETGNTRKATAAYLRCLSINPDHMMARNSLSFCARRYRKRLARWLVRSERASRL